MWWWANISARTTTSLKASSISCSAICGSVCSSCRSLSSAEVGHTSRSRRGSASIPAAARLKRSYSCSRRTSSARGSSSPSSSSLGRGSSMRVLISASFAAIASYYAAFFSCGLCFMRVPAPAPTVGAQMHGAPHFVECLARDLARLVGALGDDAAHQLRVVLELLGAPAHAADLLHDPVDQRLLAVQATDA